MHFLELAKYDGIFFCLLLMFVLADLVNAQQQNLNFNHITQQDGLSQSSGHAILQDSKGYMWFGTNDGLNKYNGYEMTVYRHNPDDSTTISGNNISYIYEDSRGNLWIGTTGAGLNLFSRDTESFSYYKVNYQDIGDGISNNSISSITEDREDRLWIGTDYGLNVLDRKTGKFNHFYADSSDATSLSDNMVRSIYEDSEGNLWVGTEDGLNKWDAENNSSRIYRYEPSDPNSLSNSSITKIYEDKEGVLWIGTQNGLNRFDREKGIFYRYIQDDNDPYSISGNSILSILEDSHGTLWIGTENDGLNAFDREKERFYHYRSNLDDPNSLSNNSVYSLYENDDQILFIGTYSGGINYLDRKNPKFEHYTYDSYIEHPLSAKSVTSFLEDSRGNFWVGTDGGGLNRFDRETKSFHTMRHEPGNRNSLSSDVILALLEDSRGFIWIGYYNGGISRYDPDSGTFQHFKHRSGNPGSLCQNDVFSLYEDREGVLWVGTNGNGVCKYNPDNGEFTRFQAVEGVIRDMYEDPAGNFWLGTYGGGLKLLDRQNGDVWNYYEGDYGLRSNVVLVIHRDQNENFWIGTSEGGLHRFDRDKPNFVSYSLKDGLPSNIVKGILEDDHGNLWLSTNKGISKFNPGDKTFTNYSIEDGLQGEEFNTLAYYKDREGYMYFGGINGFNRFHPDSVQKDTHVYPVVFSDFKIFNRSVAIGDDSPLQKHISETQHIELPHTATVLTFEYAALNFNKIKGVRYAYKLEGFDEEWNHVDNRRSATYTNLSPGEYMLRVQVANSDEIWNEDEATLSIVITPPFWQTTWFYFLSAILVTGLIIGGYRYRVRSITQQNKRLAQKVAERTSELNEKNQELKRALKDLKETRSELVDKAHKAGMADLAAGVLHNVGNILNSVNISAAVIEETLQNSKFHKLKQANELLEKHKDNLDEFLLNDPRGKNLIDYYLKLEKPLDNEHEQLKEQVDRLNEKIQLIIEVIDAQQNYAKVGRINEKIQLERIVEDTLKLQAGSIERHGLNIQKDYADTDRVVVQKSKLIHILINFFKNAKEAMEGLPQDEKKLMIRTWQDSDNVCLSVTDNGEGIQSEHREKIFKHGFTTKEKGHGFGLHTCANYMAEMGGKISVSSDGQGRGATFTLMFPKSGKHQGKHKNFEEPVVISDDD